MDVNMTLVTNPRDPCIQIIPTLGPNVCNKYYLHWAIWMPRVSILALTVGSEGLGLRVGFVIWGLVQISGCRNQRFQVFV